MAQGTLNIINQGFPSFRADLNDQLEALATLSSGPTAPTTTYPFQLWVDTSVNPPVLRQRNAANNAFVDLGSAAAVTATNLNRQIIAGDGLSGGGLLNANRTLNVDGTVVRTTGDQTIAGEKTFSSVSVNTNGLTVGTDQLVTSGGNVGIGTSSPTGGLAVLRSTNDIAAPTLNLLNGGGNARFISFQNGSGTLFYGGVGLSAPGIYVDASTALALRVDDTERMRIASNGQQSSVIPGGSTLFPEFKCRAWVNFDGTTSPGTIRASGNVSSVTRNGTGDFTVNFTTAMPDASYAVGCSTDSQTSAGSFAAIHINTKFGTYSASSIGIVTNTPGQAKINRQDYGVQIFR